MASLRRIVFYSFLCITLMSYANRSIHRPADPLMPEITTYWTDDPKGKHYALKSPYLEEWAIFGRYNQQSIDDNQLPAQISYRYEPDKSVPATELSKLIEDLVQELSAMNRKPESHSFKHFTVLKDRNYNYRMHAGLIILKFKNYPFVVKLFMETPESFTRPYTKGAETSLFFLMGGGINRYLAGFTRIPNLHAMREQIKADPVWSKRITLPRKWYWIPQHNRTFTIAGKNIGPSFKNKTIALPSIYAIICDEIHMDRQLTTLYKEDRKQVREIINFLGNQVDPHIYNFFTEKETGNIAIIDTEHFASMVGLKEPMHYKSNARWYIQLANKCWKDSMFRTKKSRRALQKNPVSERLNIHAAGA